MIAQTATSGKGTLTCVFFINPILSMNQECVEIWHLLHLYTSYLIWLK